MANTWKAKNLKASVWSAKTHAWSSTGKRIRAKDPQCLENRLKDFDNEPDDFPFLVKPDKQPVTRPQAVQPPTPIHSRGSWVQQFCKAVNKPTSASSNGSWYRGHVPSVRSHKGRPSSSDVFVAEPQMWTTPASLSNAHYDIWSRIVAMYSKSYFTENNRRHQKLLKPWKRIFKWMTYWSQSTTTRLSFAFRRTWLLYCLKMDSD